MGSIPDCIECTLCIRLQSSKLFNVLLFALYLQPSLRVQAQDRRLGFDSGVIEVRMKQKSLFKFLPWSGLNIGP